MWSISIHQNRSLDIVKTRKLDTIIQYIVHKIIEMNHSKIVGLNKWATVLYSFDADNSCENKNESHKFVVEGSQWLVKFYINSKKTMMNHWNKVKTRYTSKMSVVWHSKYSLLIESEWWKIFVYSAHK